MYDMHTNNMVSVVTASRNEKYTAKTVRDLLKNAAGPIEVIVVLDGWWDPEIVSDDRVVYLHYSDPRGMRNALNKAVAIARGDYILKTDSHCMFGEGYDEILKRDCGDNWVVVPRRYALDPERWELEDNPKYPIDYMYLSKDLHGEPWQDKNRDKALEDKKVDDLMSAQGSCWFMKKSYFKELGILDESTYGSFWNEFQEIGLKCWLTGGRVVVNKNTWYAHWHKPKSVGRGYSLRDAGQEAAQEAVAKYVRDHQKEFDEFINKFAPVPTWT